MNNLFPLPPSSLDPKQWPGMTLYAATILLEAESEPDQGKLAVAWVIKNRMEHAKTGSIHEVVLKPYQFSCFNADYAAQRKARLSGIDPVQWAKCWEYACAAYWGLRRDQTNGAIFYLNPELTRRIRPTGDLPDWYDPARVTYRAGKHEFLTG